MGVVGTPAQHRGGIVAARSYCRLKRYLSLKPIKLWRGPRSVPPGPRPAQPASPA